MSAAPESPLAPGAFDPETNRWRPLHRRTPADLTLSRLTVVTFNVWFAEFEFRRRTTALLRILRECDAEVIALQEVTPRLLAVLLQTPWIRSRYALSDIFGASVEPYGVLLLSRLPIHEWRFHPLPTNMDRSLLTATAHVNGAHFTFAAVHLESLRASAPVRAAQLSRIFSLLKPNAHQVLMGDFNFCAAWGAENDRLAPAYLDLWPAVNPHSPGYTEDPEANPMPREYAGVLPPVRFDRVLLRSEPPGWAPESMRLLGTEPVDPEHPQVYPSDHFGLAATLLWEGEVSSDAANRLMIT